MSLTNQKQSNHFLSKGVGLFCAFISVAVGEDFTSLEKFENTKGWAMTDSVSLNTSDNKQLVVSEATGNTISNGSVKNPAQYLKTKTEWGDHEINVEYMIPQSSNSGFYVLGLYEVQIFDSFGKSNPTHSDAGAIYERWDDSRREKDLYPGYEGVKPLKNMVKKPGEWNSMTIKFRAPRFNEFKEKTAHAQFLEVILNGEVVQKHVEAKGPTRSHPEKFESATGSLYIQGDHGPLALRNLRIEKRDYSAIGSSPVSATDRAPMSPSGEPLIEMVALGKEAFTGKGCIECHSNTANNKAVKTGPSLYGLFKEIPVDHAVVDGYEMHDQTVTANEKYFISSVRSSTNQLAKKKDGEPYLPIMPSYSEKLLTNTELRGIYSYLKTLNVSEESGPAKVYEEAQKELPYDPDLDAQAVNTYAGTKVVRGFVKNGSSARGIHVGLDNGQNYAFDPMTLAVKAIWTGRFLDMREEVNGRGGKMNELGEGAKSWGYPYENFMRPLLQSGQPYASTALNAYKAKGEFSKGAFTEFLDTHEGHLISYTQEKEPVITYELEGNLINLRFTVADDGVISAKVWGDVKTPLTLTYPIHAVKAPVVSGGVIDGVKGHWTIPVGNTEHTWTAVAHKPHKATQVKRPAMVVSSPMSWKASEQKVDLLEGFSLENSAGPVYSTGASPLFEPTAIDFAEDGTPYVGSRAAGIWTINNGMWEPFALGTFDVLGLSVVKKGEIIISQKPEVTRITDTNGDGKADKYETLCDDFYFAGNYHAYVHGPAVAKDGSVFFNINLQHMYNDATFKAGGDWMGSVGGLRGWSCRISPSGEFEPFAYGLRSPAGIAFSDKDELYYTDNQGEYMGTSKLFRLQKGKFYGHPSSLVDLDGYDPERIINELDEIQKTAEVAAILLPHNLVANSPGNPVWDNTAGAFGPYSGQVFVGDQTLSNIHRISLETVNGVEQGSIMPFMDKLPSGPMRLSFSPEGELWVGQTGRGWASRGGELSALQKIKWTGNGGLAMHRIEARKNGFEIFFTQPVTEVERATYAKIKVDSWYYTDSKAYGSDEKGNKESAVSNLVWSADGASLRFDVEGLDSLLPQKEHPGDTSRVVRFDLKETAFGASKTAFHSVGYYTLNQAVK